jgi:hypothetical protein
VLLDPRLPDGPWQAHLTLTSGVTRQEVTATITFPRSGATSRPVLPARHDCSLAALVLTLIVLTLVTLVLDARHQGSRVQVSLHRRPRQPSG